MPNRRNMMCIDVAAERGKLHAVQTLHASVTNTCTTWAMDGAAKNGHLDVVRWLHENRKEGCTTGAADMAVRNGHRHVVRWLHAHRTEGCTEYTCILCRNKRVNQSRDISFMARLVDILSDDLTGVW